MCSEGGVKRPRKQKERQGLVGVAILVEDTVLHCQELLEFTGSCSGWQLGKQELRVSLHSASSRPCGCAEG